MLFLMSWLRTEALPDIVRIFVQVIMSCYKLLMCNKYILLVLQTPIDSFISLDAVIIMTNVHCIRPCLETD